MIDWSDPEEMLGLLAEFIRDEVREEQSDQERKMFLRSLRSQVDALAADADAPIPALLARLRDICDAQPIEFASDPVLVHVRDCIQELSRILSQSR